MPEKSNLPIGYWIKQVDELLTQSIDHIQLSNNLTRLQWQLLNAVDILRNYRVSNEKSW